MSITRADGLALTLEEFLRQCPDVDAAAVISSDGLPMASALPSHIHEDRLGAMAAAMLSLGDRAAETLGRGRLKQVFVEGSNGYVFLMAAGPAVLCAITQKKAKIGLVIYEMQTTASVVGNILMEGEVRAVQTNAAPVSPAPQPAAVEASPVVPEPRAEASSKPADLPAGVTWDDYQES